MKKLNAAQVKSIKKPGLHRADAGLYLRVRPTGYKSWVQRIVIGKERSDISLGEYPAVSLAQAKDQAARYRLDITDGRNPASEKRAEKRNAKMPTFEEAAERTHKSLVPTWRSDQHAVRWLRTLKKHAIPKLGNLPVDQVTKSDVLGVLEPIWHTTPETARRIRQRIRSILKYCQAHDYVEHNVAGEGIDGALPKNKNAKKHHRAMPYDEMPETMRIIESTVDSLPARLCMKFLILTATRSGEARGARWSEIDLESTMWTVPGERMKGGKAHRVPLSRTALEVLEEAQPLRDDSALIFPSPLKRGHGLSDMTLMMTLRRIELADKTVVHGFRSSFRTWALECTDIPWEVCEAALAHVLGNQVERSYARSDLLERRRPLMQEWDAFVSAFST